VYKRLKAGDGELRGVTVLRWTMSHAALLLTNGLVPFSRDFRNLFIELSWEQNSYKHLLLNLLTPHTFTHPNYKGAVPMMWDLYRFINENCCEKEVENKMSILNEEIHWQQIDTPQPPLVSEPLACSVCQDNEPIHRHLHCEQKSTPGGQESWLIHSSTQQHKDTFAATLICAHKDTLKIMPTVVRILDLQQIFNASAEKDDMTYPTGTKDNTPVYCETNSKSRKMTGTNYFVHIRKVLETMRGKTPDPIIIEGLLSHDTNEPQEIESMVTSFVDNMVSI